MEEKIVLETRDDKYYVLRQGFHGMVPILVTKDKHQADLMMEYLKKD